MLLTEAREKEESLVPVVQKLSCQMQFDVTYRKSSGNNWSAHCTKFLVKRDYSA